MRRRVLALAATWHRNDAEHAPDVVLLPELDLDFDALVKRVDTALSRKGRAFLIVSEGVPLDDAGEQYEAVNHTTLLHGGIARHVAARLSAALCVSMRPI